MASGLQCSLPSYNLARNIKPEVYDYIVIGAGIVGSWTAYHLTEKTSNVLLLEQFTLPTGRGCSAGRSRVTRTSYEEDYFANIMPSAMQMWKDLQQKTDDPIFISHPVLIMEKGPKHPRIEEMVSNMRRIAPNDLETLESADDVHRRFPAVRYSNDHRYILDHSGGILLANKALEAVQRAYADRGGELREHTKVLRLVTRSPNSIIVATTTGKYEAKAVIVCAGNWTNNLLASTGLTLPITPVQVMVYYWKEKTPGEYSTKEGKFPVFLDSSWAPTELYGIPSYEYPGFCKVLFHQGFPCNPDKPQKVADVKDANLKVLKTYIAEHFPGLDNSEPAIVETCHYTKSKDDDFIVDRHPIYPNIIIGTGFSGTGFKTSPAIGKCLAALATNEKPHVDISMFSVSRFADSCYTGQARL